MVLFIGPEPVPFPVQAEGFVEEPLAAGKPGKIVVVHGFVAAAAQFVAVAFQYIAELFGLGGMDVEKGHVPAPDLPGFPVFHGDEMEPGIQELQVPRVQQQPGGGTEQGDHLIVAVDPGFSHIGAPFHGLHNHPDHPEDPQHMVHMPVGDENILDFLPGQPGPLQLAQDPVAPAPVHQQVAFILAQHIAGVVAPGGDGMACTQKQNFHTIGILPCSSL